jgi:TonB family protein
MSGSVLVRVKIRPNGEVERTSVVRNDGLSDGVTQCVVRKIDAAQFDPPKGDGASLDVPVKFAYQR